MKARSILCMISLILISCNQTNDEYAKWQNDYKKLEASEGALGIKKDTIILDYRFDMDDNELMSHTNKLIKDGKIKKESDEFIFELQLGDNKVPFSFGYKTYNGRLNFFRTETKGLSSFNDLNKYLTEKYGNYNLVKKPLIALHPTQLEYTWIKGNREIVVLSDMYGDPSDAVIMFSDLSNEEPIVIPDNSNSTGKYVVNKDVIFAATSEANYNLMMNCLVSGDRQAVERMVLTSQIKYLHRYDVVYLVTPKFKYYIVRPEGSTETLYVDSELLTKK
jgi:hypothetical protein